MNCTEGVWHNFGGSGFARSPTTVVRMSRDAYHLAHSDDHHRVLTELLPRALADAGEAEPGDDVILDAALDQVAAYGLRRTTMDDVARRAGVGRMTVYRRFATKGELLQRLVAREAQRMVAAIGSAAETETELPDRVVAAFVAALRLTRQHPLVDRLVRMEPEALLELAQLENPDLLGLARTFVAAELRRGQSDGAAGPVDADQAAEVVVRLVISFVVLPRSVVDVTDEEAARRVRPPRPRADPHGSAAMTFTDGTLTEGPTLGRLDPLADTGFDRHSAIRRVTAEPAIGLILQHALTMEVAHAKVGAGVQHHSLFRGAPWKRLWSTMDVALRLVWGDAATSRDAAQQVYSFHDHVNGELPEPAAAYPEGASYTAHDASLLLWVWATLVEVAEVAHARWLAPLSPEESAAFYADMTTFALCFGIPADLIPPDREAFAKYWDAVVDGDELVPTPTSEAMVRDVLWFSHATVPAPLVRPLRVLSIGTLDPQVRARFGLELSDRDQRLFDRLDGLLARTYRFRPAWLLHRLPGLYVTLRRPTIGMRRRS